MINFFNEDIDFPKINLKKTREWINKIILYYQKEEGDLNYIFCSDQYLIEINKKFLNHNYFTDIISFNYNEKNDIAGDIFISIDTVSVNSKEYQVSFVNELHRVMIHGVLHLLGFDDKTDEQKIVMRQKENEALNIFPF